MDVKVDVHWNTGIVEENLMSCLVSRFTVMGLIGAAYIGLSGPVCAAPPPPYPINLAPGGAAEQAYLVKTVNSKLNDNIRSAPPGGFWVYALPVIPGKRCWLQVTCDLSDSQTLPVIKALGLKNKPVHVDTAAAGKSETAVWKAPAAWKLGSPLLVTVSAHGGDVSVISVNYRVEGSSGPISSIFAHFIADGGQIAPDVIPSPGTPVTITPEPPLPDASAEPETDAVVLDTPTLSAVDSWMARGYTVWGRYEAPPALPAFIDTDAKGNQLESAGIPVSVSVPAELQPEIAALQSQIALSGAGIVLPALSMPITGGYSPPFLQAWQQMYGSQWLPPTSSTVAGYCSGHLMSRLLTQRVAALETASISAAAGVTRAVSMLDPVSALEDGLVVPAWHIGVLPGTGEVIFHLDPALWQSNVPMEGALRPAPFSRLLLGYSAAAASIHNLPVRFKFELPEPDTANGSLFWQSAVAAALTASGIDGFSIPALTSTASPAQQVESGVIRYVLQQLPVRSTAGRMRPAQVGVAVGDSLQWHNPAGLDAAKAALFGQSLPIMDEGYPLKVVGLERTVDPSTMARLKTMVLSYDDQVPVGVATNTALATWVNQGGSLILLGGGTSPVSRGWLSINNTKTPLQDLWSRLAISFQEDPKISTPPVANSLEPAEAMKISSTVIERNLPVTLGVVPTKGSLAISISVNPEFSSAQVTVSRFSLLVDGKVVASFLTGSPLDSRFIVLDNGSTVSPLGRTISGHGSVIYRFDNLPVGKPISCEISETGPINVGYGEPPANTLKYLVPVGTAMGLAQDFPLIQVKGIYGTVQFPGALGSNVIPLYTAPGGAPVIWAAHAGRGLVIQCGIPPAAFTSGDRSGTFLRSLVALALRSAGGYFREQGAMVTTRGHLIAVHTYQKSVTLDGRTADLFSPDLQIEGDRIIGPHQTGLYWQMPDAGAPPRLEVADGRLAAKLQTASLTGFVLKGALASPGVVLLQSGGRTITGVRAIDYYGRAIPVQITNQGNSVLLQFPLNPDGVAVKVGWK